MSSGNGGNAHGEDVAARVSLLEERMENLLLTIQAQQATLTVLRVLHGLQVTEIDNLRERVDRLEST